MQNAQNLTISPFSPMTYPALTLTPNAMADTAHTSELSFACSVSVEVWCMCDGGGWCQCKVMNVYRSEPSIMEIMKAEKT